MALLSGPPSPPRSRALLALLPASLLLLALLALSYSAPQAEDAGVELLSAKRPAQLQLLAQMEQPKVVYVKGHQLADDEEEADEGEGQDEEEEEEEEEDSEPHPPKVKDMARAQREVMDDKARRILRTHDYDSRHEEPKDHYYYSGPATSRHIPMTDTREMSPLKWHVSTIPDYGSGSSIATNNALYKPRGHGPEHDVQIDIEEGALYHPTRNNVARALEHVESKEIGTEFFHDTLVDNNHDSSHYQQHIHVQHVPGSKNNHNGLLAWNGIGGIFGPGGMLGPEDNREDVDVRAKRLPSGALKWTGDKPLDTERILTTGTRWTDEVRGVDRVGQKDQAEAVLRRAVPKEIKPQFLDYDPADPRGEIDPTEYHHSWAAYTREGSKRRIEAARGQIAYEEWRKTHRGQGIYAEHGVPCFNGKVKCRLAPEGGDEDENDADKQDDDDWF